MIEHGHHVTLLELMGQPTTSLYARKALASAICNLAALSEHAESLCRAGAVGGLLKVQNSDPRVWRKRVDVTVARLSLEVVRHSPDALGQLKVEERDTIYKLAEGEAKQADSSPLHSVRASLIESGVLLYFHTAAGGAAWGLFESLRSQQPRAKLVQNVVRTSLVTCFVPILLVRRASHICRPPTARSKLHMRFRVACALVPGGWGGDILQPNQQGHGLH